MEMEKACEMYEPGATAVEEPNSFGVFYVSHRIVILGMQDFHTPCICVKKSGTTYLSQYQDEFYVDSSIQKRLA